MTSVPDGQESLRQHILRSLLVGAALVAFFIPLDARYGPAAIAWRAGWAAVLLAAAALQRRGRPRLGVAAAFFAASASGLFQAVLVAVTHGTSSPRFGILAALPLAVLILLPDLPLAAVLVFTGTFSGGLAVILLEGRSFEYAFEWTLLALTLLVVTLVGAMGFRRVWLGQLQAERAQAEAQERLAASERRSAQIERLAVVGRLAAGVAHEINNPLSFAKSNLCYLKEGRARGEVASPEFDEALDEAIHGVSRIAQIVKDMRGLAGDAPDVAEPFCVESAVREAWRIASVRLSGLGTRLEIAEGLPAAVGSPRLLVQALVNLVVNAAEAAEAAPSDHRRWVALSARADRDAVVISVEDGGPGLSEEAERRLFEPFFTTKGTRGTGLGLALVREHVARCGGSIEGENARGAGARFTIRLPLRAATGAAPDPPERPS
jgi:signal transduction histidine kinase